MDNNITNLINKAVENIIKNTTKDSKIKKITAKHDAKIHFIPKRYRVFGGLLQSMNIQFGNFIEELMSLIIQNDNRYEIVTKYSGKKSNSFTISRNNEEKIDKYISDCQLKSLNDSKLQKSFIDLQQRIIKDKDTNNIEFKHDIDLLFKNKSDNSYFYCEIKYNDDHDTGKFIDINRKFIKTFAYLAKELKINDSTQLTPLLFFFTNKRMKGNIYVPETTNILRGKIFFEKFLHISYDELDNYLHKLSEEPKNIKMFDDLYDKIVRKS